MGVLGVFYFIVLFYSFCIGFKIFRGDFWFLKDFFLIIVICRDDRSCGDGLW